MTVQRREGDGVSEAEPVGTMPPPSTVRGATTTAMKALKGEKANVLVDKLGKKKIQQPQRRGL